jgi:hypothetical protein
VFVFKIINFGRISIFPPTGNTPIFMFGLGKTRLSLDMGGLLNRTLSNCTVRQTGHDIDMDCNGKEGEGGIRLEMGD